MPNLLVRVTRYILRSRKRSASLQSSTKALAPATQPGVGDAEKGGQNTAQTPDLSVKDLILESRSLDLSDGNQPEQKSSREEHSAPPETVKEPKVQEKCDDKNTDERAATKSKHDLVAIKVSNASTQSTTVRTRRVLRELQFMMKASSRQESPFQVSLVDESNIFEWDVRLMKVDESSELWRSMRQTETECIRFRLTFPELFPFQPPFLRLVGPYLDNGFVMDGGAICMEVLTSQGWSSAYTVESLLVQVASGLTQGGAVVSTKQKRKYNQLSQKRAEAEFRRICKIHAKYGWVSMEKEDA